MTDPVKSVRIGTLVSGANAQKAIRYLLPHGFESFSLTFGHDISVDLPALAREIEEIVGDYDAVISSVCVYANPLESGDADRQAVKAWEQLIDNAHHFGANVVGGFAGRLRGQPIDASIARFKEVFEPLARRAKDRGIRLAFENCDGGGNWQTGDFNIAHHPDAWELMFDAVPHDNVGLQWEPCHQMIKLIDPMAQLRKWVHRIFHVHGKDATILWDVIREHGIAGPKPFAFHRTPGFGDSNWTDIISELRRGGFVGSIDIEGLHDPVYRGDLEITGQVHALNHLKTCRGGAYVPNY